MVIANQAFEFHYTFNNDTLYVHLHYLEAIKEQLDQGIIPFLNPYEALGVPLLQRGTLDLFSLPLLLFLDPKDYITLMGFVYLHLSIFFMYLFLRHHRIDKLLSLIGGVSWGFSPYFLFFLHDLVYSTIPTFSILSLLSISKICERKNGLLYWIILVFVSGFQISTGRWSILEYCVGTVILYILLVCGSNEKGENIYGKIGHYIKLVSLYILSLIVGFLLVAPFSFNYTTQIMNSFRPFKGFETIYFELHWATLHFFPTLDTRYTILLITIPFAWLAIFRHFSSKIPIFFTIIFGIMIANLYPSEFHPSPNFFQNLFLNTTIIILFIFLIIRTPLLPITKFATISIIISIFFCYPFGIFDLIRNLPLNEGNNNPVRIFPMLLLGINLLFVKGLQEYIFFPQKGDRKILITVFISTIIFFVVIFAYCVYIFVPQHFKGDQPIVEQAVYFFSTFILLYLLIYFKGQKTGLILLMLYLVGYSTFFDLRGGDIKWEKYKEQFNENLMSQKMTLEETLLSQRYLFLDYPSTINLPYFFPSPNFYFPLPSKLTCIVRTLINPKIDCGRTLPSYPGYHKFYSLSSVKFFILKQDNHKRLEEIRNYPFLHQVYEDKQIIVFENSLAFERIRIVDGQLITIDNLEETRDWINSKELEWFQTNVVLDKPIVLKTNSNQKKPSFRILEASPNHWSIEIDSFSEHVMIINNAYQPGWNLTINEESARIYRANLYFQGIKVIPGKHVYQLNYLPPNIHTQILVSVMVIIILFLLMLSSIYRDSLLFLRKFVVIKKRQ